MIQQTLGDNLESSNRIAGVLAISLGIISALILVVFGLVLIGGVHVLYKAGWVFSERLIVISFWTLFFGLLCGLTCAALSWAAQKGSLKLHARSGAFALATLVAIVTTQVLMSIGGVALLWWQGTALFALVLIVPLVASGRGWRNRLVGYAAFIGVTLAEVSVVLIGARLVSL